HIPLLIGGGGEQVTLKLVAQYADACNLGGDLATIERNFGILRQHGAAIGRDYDTVHRTVTGFCSIAETDEQAWAKVPALYAGQLGSRMCKLIGSPETIRKGLGDLELAGVQEVVLGFPDILQLDPLRFFAAEFIA